MWWPHVGCHGVATKNPRSSTIHCSSRLTYDTMGLYFCTALLKAAHQALAREEMVSFMSFETSQSVLILVHQGFTGKRPNALHAVVFGKWYKCPPPKNAHTHTHTHSHTHTHAHTLAQNCHCEFCWDCGAHRTCKNTSSTPDRNGLVKRPEKGYGAIIAKTNVVARVKMLENSQVIVTPVLGLAGCHSR